MVSGLPITKKYYLFLQHPCTVGWGSQRWLSCFHHKPPPPLAHPSWWGQQHLSFPFDVRGITPPLLGGMSVLREQFLLHQTQPPAALDAPDEAPTKEMS